MHLQLKKWGHSGGRSDPHRLPRSQGVFRGAGSKAFGRMHKSQCTNNLAATATHTNPSAPAVPDQNMLGGRGRGWGKDRGCWVAGFQLMA